MKRLSPCLCLAEIKIGEKKIARKRTGTNRGFVFSRGGSKN